MFARGLGVHLADVIGAARDRRLFLRVGLANDVAIPSLPFPAFPSAMSTRWFASGACPKGPEEDQIPVAVVTFTSNSLAVSPS